MLGLYKFRFNGNNIDANEVESNCTEFTKVDIVQYRQVFEDFLNTYYFDGDIYTNLIIADTMYTGSLELDNNDDVSATDNLDNSNMDTDDSYIILDYTGNVVGYGTKEESEESIRKYGNQKVFTVKNCDQVGNKLNMKVYNYFLNQAELFVVELNQDLKMANFYNVTGSG